MNANRSRATRLASRLASMVPQSDTHVQDRSDWTPYLGHVPYFAPKGVSAREDSVEQASADASNPQAMPAESAAHEAAPKPSDASYPADKDPARPRRTRFRQAFISIASMVVLIFTCVVGFGSEPQVPLVFGTLVAGLVASWIGYTWDEMLEGMVEGIVPSIEAILILLLIGMLVGVWIASGTVPTMIFYGLHLISGRFFLVTTTLICTVVSLAIGSWGTLGTVGLAFMGIGLALNVPAPMVAGCIVSGAYCGEIISPLSDATNLTAAVVGRSVFDIMKRTLGLALVALALTEAAYLVLGLGFDGGQSGAISANIDPILSGLTSAFTISPICLTPMLVMVGCIVAKLPAIPSMLLGIISGMLVAWGVQDAGMSVVIDSCFEGYVSASGNELIDQLLTAGGMMSMTNAVTIVLIAMAFGGLMERTGQMRALVGPLMMRINSTAAMTAVTVASCVAMNVVLPDQFLGISVPGQMFSEEYDRRGMTHVDLGRTLLAGGAVTSPLIPWNTCGIYCSSILGVGAMSYAPYAFLSLGLPVLMVLYAAASSVRTTRRATATVKE